MIRITKIIKRTLLTLFASLAGLLLLVQIPTLSTALTQVIVNAISSENFQVSLSKIQGAFPFEIKIQTIKISDPQGEWASIDDLEYSWRAINLLFGNVHFDHISAQRVVVKRKPEKKEPFKWEIQKKFPHLNVDRFRVDVLELSDQIIPSEEKLTLLGEINSGYFGHHTLTLLINRLNVLSGAKDFVTLAAKVDRNQVVLIAHMNDSLGDLKKLIYPNEEIDMKGDLSAKLKIITDRKFKKIYVSSKGSIADISKQNSAFVDFLKGYAQWKIKLLKQPEEGTFQLTQAYIRTGRGAYTSGDLHYNPKTADISGKLSLFIPCVQQFWDMNDQYMSGDGTLNFTVSGNVRARQLTVDMSTSGLLMGRNPIEDLRGQTRFSYSENENTAVGIRLSFKQDHFYSTLDAVLRNPKDHIWRLDAIQLAGPNTQVTGYWEVNLKDWAYEGKISGTVSDLAPYGKLVGKSLKGQLSFSTHGDRNLAQLDIEGKNFQGETMAAKQISLQMQINQLVVENIILKSQDFFFNFIEGETLEAQATLKNKNGQFSLRGTAQKKKLICNGTLSRSEEKNLNLVVQQLSLTEDQKVLLSSFSPFSILINESNVKISPVTITFLEKGHVKVQDFSYGDILSGQIIVSEFPLELLFFLNPGNKVAGKFHGIFKLAGTHQTPFLEAQFKGNIRDLSTKFRKKEKAFKLFSYQGDLKQQNGQLTGKVQLVSGKTMTVQMHGKVQTPSGLPKSEDFLDGTISAKGDIRAFNDFIAANDRYRGNLDVNLRLNGTLGNPQAKGNIALTNGIYDNTEFGTHLRNIMIQGNVESSKITLASCRATDFHKGTAACSGSLDLSNISVPNLKMTVEFEKLAVVNSDLITAKANGNLNLKIEESNLLVSGQAAVTSSDLYLQESESQIKLIKIREDRNVLDSHSQKGNVFAVAPEKSLVKLDLKVSFPQKLFVRGYGLKSQWMGDLDIKGSSKKPTVKGMLTLKEGGLDLVNKEMKLTEGRITFDGTKAKDPDLLIVASKEISGYIVFFRIEGKSSAPNLSFASVPGLPQEEVLSLILFGKPLSRASSAQSLQLALAISSLKASGGMDFTNKLSQSFGFDSLSVDQQDTSGTDSDVSSGYKLRLGKQMNDRVHFALNQAIGGGSGVGATLEIDVTKQTKLAIDVGTGKKNNSISYNWEKKY